MENTPSLISHLSQVQPGGTRARSSLGGGGPTQARSSEGVRPLPGGTPAGGYPTSATPIKPDWGYPCGGYPTLVHPPSDLARVPPQGGEGTPPRLTDGVLDTPRSVCLLRSRRRTFLFFLSMNTDDLM